jgi:hypothetical protein
MVGKSWLGVWNCRKGSVGRLVGELDLRTSFLQVVKSRFVCSYRRFPLSRPVSILSRW